VSPHLPIPNQIFNDNCQGYPKPDKPEMMIQYLGKVGQAAILGVHFDSLKIGFVVIFRVETRETWEQRWYTRQS